VSPQDSAALQCASCLALLWRACSLADTPAGNIKAEVSPGVYLKCDRINNRTDRALRPRPASRAAVALVSGPARITPACHTVEQSVVKLVRVGLCRLGLVADADLVRVNGFRLTGLFSAIFGHCEKISFANNLVL
jgi:hypothetical protein